MAEDKPVYRPTEPTEAEDLRKYIDGSPDSLGKGYTRKYQDNNKDKKNNLDELIYKKQNEKNIKPKKPIYTEEGTEGGRGSPLSR